MFDKFSRIYLILVDISINILAMIDKISGVVVGAFTGTLAGVKNFGKHPMLTDLIGKDSGPILSGATLFLKSFFPIICEVFRAEIVILKTRGFHDRISRGKWREIL